jgi:hypothetical protein
MKGKFVFDKVVTDNPDYRSKLERILRNFPVKVSPHFNTVENREKDMDGEITGEDFSFEVYGYYSERTHRISVKPLPDSRYEQVDYEADPGIVSKRGFRDFHAYDHALHIKQGNVEVALVFQYDNVLYV